MSRTCLSLGHWSGIKTNCQDVRCSPLPDVLNGSIDPPACTQLEQDYGANCKLTCRNGFNLVGPPYKQCTNTGKWQTELYDWQCVGKYTATLVVMYVLWCSMCLTTLCMLKVCSHTEKPTEKIQGNLYLGVFL